MGFTLVLGGARSGKSTYAEQLASRLSETRSLPVTYVATAQKSDDEMDTRVLRHRERRPAYWETIEEPLQVEKWLVTQSNVKVVLIDCLSLLLNNWMFLDESDETEVFARIDGLVSAMANAPGEIIVVSNEVGQGIVPANALSRRYRDYLGIMNQRAASRAERVIWVIAGIPVDLRQIEVPLP